MSILIYIAILAILYFLLHFSLFETLTAGSLVFLAIAGHIASALGSIGSVGKRQKD